MKKIFVLKLYEKDSEGKEFIINEFYNSINNPFSITILNELSFCRANISIVNVNT